MFGPLKVDFTVVWVPDQLMIQTKGKIYRDNWLETSMELEFHFYGSESWTYTFSLDFSALPPGQKRVNLQKTSPASIGFLFPVPIRIPIPRTAVILSFTAVVKPIVDLSGDMTVGLDVEYAVVVKKDVRYYVTYPVCLVPNHCGDVFRLEDNTPAIVTTDVSVAATTKGTLKGQLGFGFVLQDFGLYGVQSGDKILSALISVSNWTLR
jgi:hypothetical protein